jgi:hypothetical protein
VIFFVTRESRWKGVDPLYASVKVNAEEGVVDFTELAGLVVTVLGQTLSRRVADIV